MARWIFSSLPTFDRDDGVPLVRRAIRFSPFADGGPP